MAKKDNKSENKSKKHFFKDFKAELKKVIWPTPKQLANNTIAVVTIVLITAAIVFVLDVVFDLGNKYGISNLQSIVDEKFNSEEETDNSTNTDNTTTEGEENNTAEDNTTSDTTAEDATNTEASDSNTTNTDNATEEQTPSEGEEANPEQFLQLIKPKEINAQNAENLYHRLEYVMKRFDITEDVIYAHVPGYKMPLPAFKYSMHSFGQIYKAYEKSEDKNASLHLSAVPINQNNVLFYGKGKPRLAAFRFMCTKER